MMNDDGMKIGRGLMIMIIVGIFSIPTSITVSAFSEEGNFFETNDIAFWLTLNNDYYDKSINRYLVYSNIQPIYVPSSCYDEQMIYSNIVYSGNTAFDFLTYFQTGDMESVEDLNLNDENSDCHVRMSLWVLCLDWNVPPVTPPYTQPYSLLSKSRTLDGVYYGWDLQLRRPVGTSGGQLLLKIGNEFPDDPDIVDLDPVSDFGENNYYFFGKWMYVRAGWDFFPNGGSQGQDWGIAFIETTFKDEQNQIIKTYRDSIVIDSLPTSSEAGLYIGRDSEQNEGSNYAGMMDEVEISRGKPFFLYENDYTLSQYWNNIFLGRRWSLPHEDMIAYYNFENIEDKYSIQYGQSCTMFFDGAHFTPHNGIIEGGTYDPITTNSWDGSTAFSLDGNVYGRIKEKIDGWSNYEGNFMLSGWSKDNRPKVLELGCTFSKQGISENDMVLLSQYATEVEVGFPTIYHPYGYKIGIDTYGILFADIVINENIYTLEIGTQINLNSWYRCLLHLEKQVVDEDTYRIDMFLTLWELTGNDWTEIQYDVYQYTYLLEYPFIIGDIYPPYITKDAIIGGTWNYMQYSTVVDKFVGKIDDVKWFKSEAYDVFGYDKYHVYGS